MQQISFLTNDLMWHNGTLNKDNQGQNFINSLEDIKIRPNFELDQNIILIKMIKY